MANLIDWLAGKKSVKYSQGEGLNLAVCSIDEFKDRKFTLRGLKNKYSGISRDELLKLLQEEIDSMLVLYKYITRVKNYTDRRGVPQVKIRLIGKASAMNRYNPLDIKMDITTETTEK